MLYVFIYNIHRLVNLSVAWSNQPCYSVISLNNKLSTSQSINVPIKGDKEITLKLMFASHILMGSCGILRNTVHVLLYYIVYMTMDHSNNNWWDGLAHIQLCVSKIREWMNQNMLKLNDDKTELIVFTSKYKQDLYNDLRINYR